MTPPTVSRLRHWMCGPLLILAAAGTVLAQGVTPKQILIGQNITLQGGKNE